MTKLAKKYGLSDNGLRKICKALSVPMPKAGHWALVAAGRPPAKVPLPLTAEREIFESYHVVRSPVDGEKSPDDAEWLKEHLRFEMAPENAIHVDALPEKWHPVIRKLKDFLERCATELSRAQSKASKQTKNTNFPGYLEYPNYESLAIPKHSPILGGRTEALAIRVSVNTFQRALRVMNALAFAAEQRRFIVTLREGMGRLKLTLGAEQVDLYLSEKLSDDLKPAPESRNSLWPTAKAKVSTGVLRINIDRGWSGVSQIEDSYEGPLERSLNLTFQHVYRQIVRDREASRKKFVEDKLFALQKVKEREEQRKQDELKRLADEEAAKRSMLFKQANSFAQAEQLRGLISHVTVRAREVGKAEILHDWQAWALTVVAEIDPIADILRSQESTKGN